MIFVEIIITCLRSLDIMLNYTKVGRQRIESGAGFPIKNPLLRGLSMSVFFKTYLVTDMTAAGSYVVGAATVILLSAELATTVYPVSYTAGHGCAT